MDKQQLMQFQEVCMKLQNELVKDGSAKGGGSYGWKFVKLSTLIEKFNEVLGGFGFYLFQGIKIVEGRSCLYAKIVDENNKIVNEACLGLDNTLKNSKKNQKGSETFNPLFEYGKQITYLRRYLLMCLFNIYPQEETEDNTELVNRATKYENKFADF